MLGRGFLWFNTMRLHLVHDIIAAFSCEKCLCCVHGFCSGRKAGDMIERLPLEYAIRTAGELAAHIFVFPFENVY